MSACWNFHAKWMPIRLHVNSMNCFQDAYLTSLMMLGNVSIMGRQCHLMMVREIVCPWDQNVWVVQGLDYSEGLSGFRRQYRLFPLQLSQNENLEFSKSKLDKQFTSNVPCKCCTPKGTRTWFLGW